MWYTFLGAFGLGFSPGVAETISGCSEVDLWKKKALGLFSGIVYLIYRSGRFWRILAGTWIVRFDRGGNFLLHSDLAV